MRNDVQVYWPMEGGLVGEVAGGDVEGLVLGEGRWYTGQPLN